MSDKEALATTEKQEATNSVSEVDHKAHDSGSSQEGSDFDPYTYHEHNAGRLVVDPEYVTCALRMSPFNDDIA